MLIRFLSLRAGIAFAMLAMLRRTERDKYRQLWFSRRCLFALQNPFRLVHGP